METVKFVYVGQRVSVSNTLGQFFERVDNRKQVIGYKRLPNLFPIIGKIYEFSPTDDGHFRNPRATDEFVSEEDRATLFAIERGEKQKIAEKKAAAAYKRENEFAKHVDALRAIIARVRAYDEKCAIIAAIHSDLWKPLTKPTNGS